MQQAALETPDFAQQLRDDIAANRVQLPTLPEVALQVREAVESENSSAAEVADMVTRDPALTARLLQVANSPLYRGRVAIDNVQMAITRMGLQLVKNLVISLAMKQMFQATSEALDRMFREVWQDSVEVAAIARVLATDLPGLSPEQAMLAGLVHNIGALPVLTKLDLDLGFEADKQTVVRLVDEVGPSLGQEMLTQWQFAEEVARVPVECLDLRRERAEADYADLVLVARLEHLATHARLDDATCPMRWPEYSAFARVGIETEVTVLEMEGPAEQIAEVRELLNG
ncbi:MAG: HDOD domain-containing protein [Gammaproteobacteria bacterium]|nr:MAG: HDOD domain-containing protein [Gammaproteobacteria bacterium]